MKITYYGHSAFSVVAGGKHILFDPFISGNELAKDISIDEVPADYILVSHGHFDHILDVVAIAKRTGALVLCGWELYNYFGQQGLDNVRPINPGGKVKFDFGIVKSVTAVHSSSLPDGRYAGVANGFVLNTVDGNFYYSGDTALTLDMTLIPKWTKLDFAVLPIGDGLTMGVEEAIQAAAFVEVSHVIGVHYDTFGFIKIDQSAATTQFEKEGLTLHLPAIGGSIDLA